MGKIFRVFFSSTFSDFVEERNALQKEVFPKLKELCAAHGTRFQPIDLRWGIPDEVALQQSTMQICLEEIKRCQDLTPRPNYLVFLGDRYGWTPPPAKIPKTEYDLISAHFSEEEKSLIEKWYKHDENELCKLDDGTITTVYELQPRGEEYKEYEKWKEVEKKLRQTLLQAAREAELSKKELVKYYASATHQEIINGALEAYGAETHVHCFFRKLSGLPKGAKPHDFFEPDPEKAKFLSNLKDELQQQLPRNIHEYAVDLGDEKDKQKHLQKFCNDVYHSLQITILHELENMEDLSALYEEINNHIEFGKNRSNVFVGRKKNLNEIVEYFRSDDRRPFIVSGEPGSGKSALIARTFETLKKKGDVEFLIRFIGTTPHSSDSISLIRSICEQIVDKYSLTKKELMDLELERYRKEFPHGEFPPWARESEWKGKELVIPFNYNKLKETFEKILCIIDKKKRIIILLDALDQLPQGDIGRDLMWFPKELPLNVKIITSCATDDTILMNNLEKKFPHSLHDLKSLTLEEGEKVLNLLLKKTLRRLTSEQKNLILQCFSENGLPLFLKLAFEESCTWNSYSKIGSIKFAPNVEGIIQILFDRLYKDHTQQIVKRILCYIAIARNGLTEDEILDVMSSDLEFFKWYKEQIHHDLPEERLPWIVWSRLHFDLEPYLTIRGVDSTSTIVFFHRQFNDTVKRIVLSKIIEDRHQVLAKYFNNSQLYFQKNGDKTPNYRKLSELFYNFHKAKMWKEIKNILTDLSFIEAKCSALMIDDLLMKYNQALEELPFEYRNTISEFKLFVSNQVHILRQYPHLTIQLALNQPDNTLPSQAARNFIKSGRITQPILEWVNKPQERSLCIFTFTGHINGIYDCAFSPDGTKVLSASGDNTLKLWDVQTGAEIRTIIGSTFIVNSCAFSPDGTKILSGSLHDNTIKLWDVNTGVELQSFSFSNSCSTGAFSPDGTKIISNMMYEYPTEFGLALWDIETGKIVRDFTGHGIQVKNLGGDSKWKKIGSVNACAFSPDGKMILSASRDKTLKLWDVKTGVNIRTFKGHYDGVNDCAFSPDGSRVLSASGDMFRTDYNKAEDHTLRLWDLLTGAKIRTFIGHSDIVNGCDFSPDGKKVISASSDQTLKLWDVETGNELRTLTGHTGWVEGCAFSPDGTKVISASNDDTLKLWDVKASVGIKGYNEQFKQVYGISHDGRKALSVSRDGIFKIWEVETGDEIISFAGPKSLYAINCVFSPDDTKLVFASSWSNIRLWDINSGIEILNFTDPSNGGLDKCVFSPDSTKLAYNFYDQISDRYYIRIWDIENVVEISTFKEHSGGSPFGKITCIAFSPDGKKIVSAAKEGEGDFPSRPIVFRLWEVETGDEIRKVIESKPNGETKICSFSPDGKKIISYSHGAVTDATLKFWDVETGTEIRTLIKLSAFDSSGVKYSTFNQWGFIFSPDGTKILSESDDHVITLWDLETGRKIKDFKGHSKQVNGCDFSPDGTILVSVSSDNTLKLWDVETGHVLLTSIYSSFPVKVRLNGLISVGRWGYMYFLRPHGIELASNL